MYRRWCENIWTGHDHKAGEKGHPDSLTARHYPPELKVYIIFLIRRYNFIKKILIIHG